MPVFGMAYEPNNSITIHRDGDYKVSYTVDANAYQGTMASSVTIQVRRNERAIAMLTSTQRLHTIFDTVFSGTSVVSLQDGDVLDLYINIGQTAAATVKSAQLAVKELS
jgi:hypothetical protein